MVPFPSEDEAFECTCRLRPRVIWNMCERFNQPRTFVIFIIIKEQRR